MKPFKTTLEKIKHFGKYIFFEGDVYDAKLYINFLNPTISKSFFLEMIGHVDNDMLKIVDLHSGPFDLTSDDIQQISDVDIQESFYENMVYNDRTLLPYYLSNFNYLVEKYKYLEEDIHNLIDDLEEFDEFEEDVVIQNFDAEYFLVIMPNIEIDNTGILINSYEFLSKQFPESKNIFETQMIQRWEKSLYKLL